MSGSSSPPSDPDDSTIPLQRCPGLYINPNTPKGRGVFTSQAIPSGTIIDICSVLILNPTEITQYVEKTTLNHYTYVWPLVDPSRKPSGKTQAVVFGLGSMFNHSKQDQNVGWKRDLEREVIVYRALRDIRPGEELCISYGDHLTFEDADKPSSNGMHHENEDELLKNIQLEP